MIGKGYHGSQDFRMQMNSNCEVSSSKEKLLTHGS